MKISSVFQRKRARIEIIPLIDIIFFLLATFVMVSLSMVRNQGIPVNLPVAASGQSLEDRAVLKTITVTRDGNIFLDKEDVGIEGMSSRLKELTNQNKDIKVLVNGDEVADFGLVVKVLDAVRSLGISKVSIQTRGAQH